MKALFLLIAGLSILTGPAWSQGNQNGGTPTLVNSTGQTVGRYVGGTPEFPPAALINLGSQTIALPLKINDGVPGLTWAQPFNGPYFATTNCTGQAYIYANYSFTRLAAVAISGPPSRAFIQSGNRGQVNIQSALDNNGTCAAYNVGDTLAPASPISISRPPFYLQ